MAYELEPFGIWGYVVFLKSASFNVLGNPIRRRHSSRTIMVIINLVSGNQAEVGHHDHPCRWISMCKDEDWCIQ